MRQVAEHIAACGQCSAELEAYQALVPRLALAAPDSSPRPQVKHALLGSLEAQPDTAGPRSRTASVNWLAGLFGRSAPAWVALSLVLVFALAAGGIWLWTQAAEQRGAVPGEQMEVVALAGTAAAPDAHALLVISGDGESGALVAEHLQPLQEDEQYQLWLIRDGQRTSGAVFSVDEDGYGLAQVESPDLLSAYSAFGVTIEPYGGSPGPTGPKVLGS